jgi:hypothetical protein
MEEDNNEIHEFWQQTEEEIGEKVIDKALARCIQGCSDKNPTSELWGLFFYSESAFFFKHFTQSNWLLNIIKSNKKKSDGNKEFLLRIPRDTVIEMQFITFRNLWQRMFSNNLPHLYLRYRDELRGEVEIRMMVEKKKEELGAFLQHIGVEA